MKTKEYYKQTVACLKKGKKLTQQQRVFWNLYHYGGAVSCNHFSNITPKILNYRARICELRQLGIPIPAPKITWVDGQKHSEYTLEGIKCIDNVSA